MTDITIRLRSPYGQRNVKVNTAMLMTEFLTQQAPEYKITASKLATKLYNDPLLTQRLIAQNFATKTSINEFINKNGQIIYVKTELQQENDNEIQPNNLLQEEFENPDKMSLDQIYNVTLHPQKISKTCSHGLEVKCISCLQAWEAYVLTRAHISKIEWQQYCLERKLKKNSDDYSKKTQTITNIKLETIKQIKIQEQKLEDTEIKTVIIEQSTIDNLRYHLQKRYYNEEFMVLLYGSQSLEPKQIYVNYIDVAYYKTLMGTQIVPQNECYREIEQIKKVVITKHFGLQLVGVGFVTKFNQLTKYQILQALQQEVKCVLQITLTDEKTPVNNKRENDFLQQKFKSYNAQKISIHLTQEKHYDTIVMEAFYLKDDLQFLHKNNVVGNWAEQDKSSNMFELQLLEHQIINEQFTKSIDTDCFIVCLGVKSQQDVIVPQNIRIFSNIHAQGFFDVIDQKIIKNDQLNLSQNCSQIANKIEFTKSIIIELLQMYKAKIIGDPLFITICKILSVDFVNKDIDYIQNALQRLTV